MAAPAASAAAPRAAPTREETAALRARLAVLEREVAGLYERLGDAEDGVPLPGVHLVLEAGGFAALVPAGRVVELVRLVSFTPVPAAAPGVLGSFVFRGAPHVAVDLAALLGVQRRPALDAHLVLLEGAGRAALVVDRVRALADEPLLSRRSVEDEAGQRWTRSGLVAAWCLVGAQPVPLLDLDRLVARAEAAP